MCVVDSPYEEPRRNPPKTSCSSSARVMIAPTLTTRNSNNRRKLFRSRSNRYQTAWRSSRAFGRQHPGYELLSTYFHRQR